MDEYVKLLFNLSAYKNTSNSKIQNIPYSNRSTHKCPFIPSTYLTAAEMRKTYLRNPQKDLNAKIIHINWLVLQQIKVCDQQYCYLSCMQ